MTPNDPRPATPTAPATSPDPLEAAHPGFRSWQRMHRCRAAAARRLPPLPNGVIDPLSTEHAAWQDQHDITMARLGWAPEWQRERARRLWRDGVR